MNLLVFTDRWKAWRLKKSIDWNHDIPKHIAIMMDGNGRWGKSRGLPRSAGHYAGMKTMIQTIMNCRKINIRYLTLYAFSTENWSRPKEEVDYIINLVNGFADDAILRNMIHNNVKVLFIGDIGKFPAETQCTMRKAEALTQSNTGMVVQFAMNYGGRSELMHAIQALISDMTQKKSPGSSREAVKEEKVSEETVERYLYTSGIPSPELMIRTSGEQRLSGFLLWQSAQTELWFTGVMWPSFNRLSLYKAIWDYQQRKRLQRV